MTPRVIAIDGPSASGKSTTAQAVARALGIAHLDSGALYRGMTLVALRLRDAGAPADPSAILREAERRCLTLKNERGVYHVFLDGQSVEDEVRSETVTASVSAIAAMPEVRDWINHRLRALVGPDQTVVIDGRDIGSVVFPDAAVKVFLTASPHTRAERRLSQQGQRLDPQRVAEEAETLAARDHKDACRAVAPLRRSAGAIELDGTYLTFDEQVAVILELARMALPGAT